MQLQVKGRNFEISEQIRSYAEGKLGKLDKLVKDPTRIELELLVEKNPSISNNHIAEATVFTKGPVLRARESSADMKASIDQLVEDTPSTPTDSETEPMIVKTKQFAIKPMTAEEAVLQMDLIGHDFFVFKSAETDEINVLYRRRDGNYGLIEPQQ